MEKACMERFAPVTAAVSNLLKTDTRTILVGIDGRCGSGKTTLGNYLKEQFPCNLFHMDDFFLQKEQRTRERLLEIGGNVDYERFLEEVLLPARKGQEICYRRYNCGNGQVEAGITIKSCRLNVVEGSYSLHPYFGDIYDLEIFMDIDSDSQRERIQKRNGMEMWKRFEQEWIPKEEAYFNQFHIGEAAPKRVKV